MATQGEIADISKFTDQEKEAYVDQILDDRQMKFASIAKWADVDIHKWSEKILTAVLSIKGNIAAEELAEQGINRDWFSKMYAYVHGTDPIITDPIDPSSSDFVAMSEHCPTDPSLVAQDMNDIMDHIPEAELDLNASDIVLEQWSSDTSDLNVESSPQDGQPLRRVKFSLNNQLPVAPKDATDPDLIAQRLAQIREDSQKRDLEEKRVTEDDASPKTPEENSSEASDESPEEKAAIPPTVPLTPASILKQSAKTMYPSKVQSTQIRTAPLTYPAGQPQSAYENPTRDPPFYHPLGTASISSQGSSNPFGYNLPKFPLQGASHHTSSHPPIGTVQDRSEKAARSTREETKKVYKGWGEPPSTKKQSNADDIQVMTKAIQDIKATITESLTMQEMEKINFSRALNEVAKTMDNQNLRFVELVKSNETLIETLLGQQQSITTLLDSNRMLTQKVDGMMVIVNNIRSASMQPRTIPLKVISPPASPRPRPATPAFESMKHDDAIESFSAKLARLRTNTPAASFVAPKQPLNMPFSNPKSMMADQGLLATRDSINSDNIKGMLSITFEPFDMNKQRVLSNAFVRLAENMGCGEGYIGLAKKIGYIRTTPEEYKKQVINFATTLQYIGK